VTAPTLTTAQQRRAAIKQRRKLATIPHRLVVWVVLLGIFWDAGSLLFTGHSSTYHGPGYYWLRQMPGGMRTYGICLAVLVVATIYAFGQSTSSRQDLLLRGCLGALMVWYVGWSGALLIGWETSHQWSGAGSLGRTLAFASVCFLAARFSPKG